jgi:hypothetical protein
VQGLPLRAAKNILIIPTYDRAELLYLCLDAIAMCRESSRLDIRVFQDSHINDKDVDAQGRREVIDVVKKFHDLQITCITRPWHAYAGNSYNILTAYKDAATSKAEYVFMVEDDVIVSPDFFRYHYARLAAHPKAACSIGVRDPGHHGYASLGVAFPRETLHLIAPHCEPLYFLRQRGYCAQTFRPSLYNAQFDCEQDGLIARILEGRLVLWADVPVCQHIGWYGYHRRKSQRPQGTLEERVMQTKAILQSESLLRQWSRDFADIEVLPTPPIS